MDEKKRYALYKQRQGKCHYCGCRLKWEAFEVKGWAGGWVVESLPNREPQALCFKCFAFEGRGETAHGLTVNEVNQSAKDAAGDGAKEDV